MYQQLPFTVAASKWLRQWFWTAAGNVVVRQFNQFILISRSHPAGPALSAKQALTVLWLASPDLKTILAWSISRATSNEAVRSIAVSPLENIWANR
ncbi:MAG: hypothetical protein IPI29_06465 [Ignavibacteria bacterium]|nr:hypothetical protein [Ignavibacteria bacterium]